MPEFSSILGPLIRTADPFASQGGAYHAARSSGTRSRKHEGIDIRTVTGQPILAPFSGKGLRLADPYDDRKDSILKGLVLQAMDGLELNILYCAPVIGFVNRPWAKGEVIAHAQSLQHLYKGIQDHIHVEVWIGGVRVDPTPFFVGPGFTPPAFLST